jgi:hypothetical protein
MIYDKSRTDLYRAFGVDFTTQTKTTMMRVNKVVYRQEKRQKAVLLKMLPYETNQ